MTKRTVRAAQILRDGLRLIVLGAVALIALPTLAQAAPKTLLLYGDSLMAGLGLDAKDGFAAQLQAALDAKHLDVAVVNASVSGDTTADGLARLDWTLADRPDAVLLELGANDMLQGLPAEAVGHNLDAILDRFAADGVPVLLAGMKANPSLGQDYVAAFDTVFPTLSEKYKAALFPFFLDGVALDATLNQADGIHPNAVGVKRIVANILPYVEQLLAAATH
ncbi:acyl-CoA thioesterase-1 [Devosia sp. UYZn731]|uniref:arylesterase n=1 Tax=Devosia sp. UYZn731 TaxID=3156345 RepID=UPI003392F2A7